MTDIVERLRARMITVARGDGQYDDIPDEDCWEAADEIERLRSRGRAQTDEEAMTDIEKQDEIEAQLRAYVENICGKDEPRENYLCWQAANVIAQLQKRLMELECEMNMMTHGRYLPKTDYVP